MKRVFTLFAVGILILTQLSGCEEYYFSKPQPVDGKNIYITPKEWRGAWVDDSEIMIIGEDFFAIVERKSKKKVYNGIWNKGMNKPNTTVDSIYTFDGGLREIQYDSLLNTRDTVIHYKLYKQKIYKVEGRNCSPGIPYQLKDDTLYFNDQSTAKLYLGKGAFLRKVSENLYVLNVLSNSEPDQKITGWWAVSVLQFVPGNKLKLMSFSSALINSPDLVYKMSGEYGGVFYFEAAWKKADILEWTRKELIYDDGAGFDLGERITLKKYFSTIDTLSNLQP